MADLRRRGGLGDGSSSALHERNDICRAHLRRARCGGSDRRASVGDGVGGAVEGVGPAFAVDDAVVELTQADEVVDAGVAAVFPRMDVMCFRAVGFSFTARESAALVAGFDRTTDVAGCDPLGAATSAAANRLVAHFLT